MTDWQTDDGQSDPYVALWFADTTLRSCFLLSFVEFLSAVSEEKSKIPFADSTSLTLCKSYLSFNAYFLIVSNTELKIVIVKNL